MDAVYFQNVALGDDHHQAMVSQRSKQMNCHKTCEVYLLQMHIYTTHVHQDPLTLIITENRKRNCKKLHDRTTQHKSDNIKGVNSNAQSILKSSVIIN